MFLQRRKEARLLSLAALPVAVLVSFPEAASADEKRYPASFCRQHAGPGAFLYFSSLVAPGLPAKSEPRHNNFVCPPPQGGGCLPCKDVPACRNDTTFNVKVDCPIPKSFPDAGIEDVTVDVIDRHDVLNVECFLTSAIWDPAINDFQQHNQKLATVGNGNNIQPLKFSTMRALKPAAHWYIACSLPANSAIISYFVDEK